MNVNQVADTLRYVRQFAGETILVKLGGALLEDSSSLEALCRDLALTRSVGVKVMLVHGGGPIINRELEVHGINWDFFEGQRVTSKEMMDVVEMVLTGKVNKKIVRTLNKEGVSAVGMCGADGNTLLCRQLSPELGQVGAVDRVDPRYINMILNSSSEFSAPPVPVMAPTGVDHEGKAYNVNADWAACKIAIALGVKKLVYMTNEDGILDGSDERISELDAIGLQKLIDDGVVSGGMLAKTRTVIEALKNGVLAVHILNGGRNQSLIEELFTAHGSGTVCRYRSKINDVRKSWGKTQMREVSNA